MKNFIRISILFLVAVSFFPPLWAGKTESFQDLLTRLETDFQNHWKGIQGVKLPTHYLAAKSKIQEAIQFEKENAGHEDLDKWMKTCSLYVNLASSEMNIMSNEQKIKHIQHQRDSILLVINDTYQKINQIERGYSSNLKEDLEAQRKKLLERQEEARKKFDALQSDVIQVKKDARGIILSMSDILFDVGKSALKPSLKTNLAKIAGILTVYKQAKVIVEGHTDNVGGEEYNQKLSENRAANVMGFLVEQGITEDRLQSVGYGFSKPVADNNTSEGRQKNRRVDLIIAEKKSADE